MKRSFILSTILVLALSLNAQVKFSVLGDSYSTFKDCIPEGYETWYGAVTGNDVVNPADTWWSIIGDANGMLLEKNNSWSGTTICNTGYYGDDYSDKSFLTRSADLGNNPDIIYVFGGTNDAWAKVPLGEFDGTDMYSFRPAMAAMLDNIKANYPDALTMVIINTELTKDFEESIITICNQKDVPYILLENIDKQRGHPSDSGMKAISSQVWKATAPLLYDKLSKK